MIEIARLDAAVATRHLDDLRELLTDAVDDGAAVTFLAPIPRSHAAHFWRGRIEAITARTCVLLAAFDDRALVGSVQVSLDTPPKRPFENCMSPCSRAHFRE